MGRVRANLNAAASAPAPVQLLAEERGNAEVGRRVVHSHDSSEAMENPRAHILGRVWRVMRAFFPSVVMPRVEDDLGQMGLGGMSQAGT